jgi:hypothetical protein
MLQREWRPQPAVWERGLRVEATKSFKSGRYEMAPSQPYDTWSGLKVIDIDGKRIGTLQNLFVNRRTGEPEWATVKTGMFGQTGRAGLKTVFVPLVGANRTDADHLRLAIQGGQVTGAPRLAAGAALTPEDEGRLHEHYRSYADAGHESPRGTLERVL